VTPLAKAADRHYQRPAPSAWHLTCAISQARMPRPPRPTPATRPAGHCWSPRAAATTPSRQPSATRRAGSTTSPPPSPTCASSPTGATRSRLITAGARSPRRPWTGSKNACP